MLFDLCPHLEIKVKLSLGSLPVCLSLGFALHPVFRILSSLISDTLHVSGNSLDYDFPQLSTYPPIPCHFCTSPLPTETRPEVIPQQKLREFLWKWKRETRRRGGGGKLRKDGYWIYLWHCHCHLPEASGYKDDFSSPQVKCFIWEHLTTWLLMSSCTISTAKSWLYWTQSSKSHKDFCLSKDFVIQWTRKYVI